MTNRQLAWGIAIWPFVLVLEFLALSFQVGYDWDMSAASVVALIVGYAAAALLIAAPVWLPLGGLLSRRMEHSSRGMQAAAFVALGFALGVVAAIVFAAAAALPIMLAGLSMDPSSGPAFIIGSVKNSLMLILPSVLGWLFATAMVSRRVGARRSSRPIGQPAR